MPILTPVPSNPASCHACSPWAVAPVPSEEGVPSFRDVGESMPGTWGGDGISSKYFLAGNLVTCRTPGSAEIGASMSKSGSKGHREKSQLFAIRNARILLYPSGVASTDTPIGSGVGAGLPSCVSNCSARSIIISFRPEPIRGYSPSAKKMYPVASWPARSSSNEVGISATITVATLNRRQGGTYIGGAEKIGLCAAD